MEACFVGIDWGTKEHQITALGPDGQPMLESRTGTSPEELLDLRDALLALVEQPELLHVAIEDPTRAIVDIMGDAGAQMYFINPRQVDRLRDVHRMAATKDDKLDAFVIADELRLRPAVFEPITPHDPLILALGQWSRAYDECRDERLAKAARLRDKLRRYFPQFLQLPWAVDRRVSLELLELIPTPEAARQVSLAQVEQVLGRCRKMTAADVLDVLAGPGLSAPDPLVDAASQTALMQVGVLKMLNAQQKRCETQLQAILAQLTASQADEPVSDVELAMSLPGVGFRVAATMFAEGARAIAERDLERFRCKSVAPVTVQTGKQKHTSRRHRPTVRRRYACNKRLADVMYHCGRVAAQRNSYYGRLYADMRARGLPHARSCRQVADRVLGVFFAMLDNRTPYDPKLHGATRRRRAG